jgi:hypothetical protein
MNLDLDFETIAAVTVLLRIQSRDEVRVFGKAGLFTEINTRWLKAVGHAEQREIDAGGEELPKSALPRQREAGVE